MEVQVCVHHATHAKTDGEAFEEAHSGTGEGCAAGPPSGATSLHVPIRLSSASEASASCMVILASIHEPQLRAKVVSEEDGLLCDSGPISLGDADWVCLSGSDSLPSRRDVPSYRLFSLARECQDGWTLCFDLKERADSVFVLRHVHVVQSRGSRVREGSDSKCEDDPAAAATAPAAAAAWTANIVDCTEQLELGGQGLHPTHSRLLTLFRQPGEQLLSLSFWNALAKGRLTVCGGPAPSLQWPWQEIDASQVEQRRSQLRESGYSALHGIPWARAGVSLVALAETMDSMQDHGLPPVFIFMFDETWWLLLQLFEIAAHVLCGDAVDMSLSVFAWALQHHGAAEKKIGSNFGRPHRDQSYTDCHTQDGRLSMLTTWLPLVPVTVDSGCMCVVPAGRDPLLETPGDPLHMNFDVQAVREHGEPLPCDAGELLMWRADLIHWGSSCAKPRVQPRKSLSTMFMLPCEGKSNTITKAEVQAGLGLDARLRVVLRTLLQYKVWYPDFAGLSLPQ